MQTKTVHDDKRLAELAEAHSAVEQQRQALREAMTRRAELVRGLHTLRAYTASRMASTIDVPERTLWSWIYKAGAR